MDPIAQALDLNAVRNLLLDWVSAGLGDAAPEAVARMIKLEVKQAQTAVTPAPVPAETALAPGRPVSKVASFSVLVAPPNTVFVLAKDQAWVAALEKEPGLAQGLASGTAFSVAGHQLFVTNLTPYTGGRLFYECVAVGNGPQVAGVAGTQ
jgi:hypothetical protein